MDMNARFCRILLQQSLKDLTGREVEHFRANATALRVDRHTFLFEWGNAQVTDGGTFTREVQADNVAEAKSKGITQWLMKHAPQARALDWPPRNTP